MEWHDAQDPDDRPIWFAPIWLLHGGSPHSSAQANTLAEAGGGNVPSISQFGGALQRQDAAQLPIDSEEISRAMGVNPDDFERHSALGDVLWARAIWDRIHQIGDPT